MTKLLWSLYEALFGTTAHWNYHAWLMFTIWIVLVPASLLLTRFGKPAPSLTGIAQGSPKLGRKLFWFTIHRVGLSVLVLVSVIGGLIAVVASSGVSGTLHALFGMATVSLGVIQIVSAWLRGSHGVRDAARSVAEKPVQHGDHYDMTARRRWFEAYHKTVGWLTVASALGAVATGLSQYWMPEIGIALAVLALLFPCLAVVLEATGFRHDTYLSNFGTGAHHPYNRKRIEEMSRQ
ncbi:hypothetical protein FJ930_26875 [Mesorhizobium sp. B2-4-15]|uniref:cytochrome b561 domain-containing protein n=1 Tax=Mesorhizobium sp. B2-4-15 TaxID=2589934 RepID=UPI00114F31C5|nr:cytochrome b561 domain-containing protein [Mesorhizobium sp. B2-4-15]TPK62413.1 hypothetical protein FJ930_26875 [Mesorhizobium sp. B2-4-15]